jgi:signal transduction histidine kinase
MSDEIGSSKINELFNDLYLAGHKSFDLPIERLVAFLRIALTAFCLAVLITTPESQRPYTAPFQLLLAAYALVGVTSALLPTIGRYRTGWQLPVHLIDIGVVSILMYFSERLATTFFILYVFVLLSATFRWNWRGALWTVIALFGLQLTLLLAHGPMATPFIVQWAFLFVVGGVFVFFGVSRDRSAERLSQIASWPSAKPNSFIDIDEHWLDASLIHIATVLRTPRVLVTWQIAQEPYSFTTHFANGQCRQDREIAKSFEHLVHTELEGAAFAAEAAQSNECLTLQGIKHYRDRIIDESLQTRFAISSFCSASFSGDYCKGRLFMLDRSDWTDDDLMLAEIAASRLRLELEYYAIYVQLKETAASRERILLARDLHDGALQTLTAAGLQLASIASRSGQEVKHKIENVRNLLLDEQKRIRAFVEGRQPSPQSQRFNLHHEMQRKIQNIERQWGCSTALSVTPKDATVPLALMRQIEMLVAEAAANAVQHGKASHIKVAVKQTSNHIQLKIGNDGLGLKNLIGTFGQGELAARGIGPRSIARRINELNGTLSLSSSPKGVDLSIEIPM